MKKTSQRSLLFRQNVNRTEAEWVHFLDGYRKALIEFDMKKFGDDWHTAGEARGGRGFARGTPLHEVHQWDRTLGRLSHS